MTVSESKKIEDMKSGDKSSFLSVFDALVIDVMDALPPSMPTEGREWIKKCMLYCVPGGKMNRGLMVEASMQAIKEFQGVEVTANDVKLANVLGWCVEWLQAVFLVADDIMDQSTSRRGQPCWYKKPEIGLVAINDSMLLQSCLFQIMKKYFGETLYYPFLLELFNDVIFKTELGQLMDLITAPENDVDLNRFSMEKYKWIVEYKTAYYSFYLPVALAMHMCGIKESAAFDQARGILIPLGVYFQVQDDYLDCYGLPEHIGKVGTDIQDNKCSWLVNTALELANDQQKAVLAESYGKRGAPEAERAVKRVFEELGIEKRYNEYEEESYKLIVDKIESLQSETLPRKVFDLFVAKIYKRSK